MTGARPASRRAAQSSPGHCWRSPKTPAPRVVCRRGDRCWRSSRRATVQLGALKAAGNPLAGGSGQHVDPADGVAVRLVETSGATTDVAVRSGLRRVSAAARVDLLEQPRSSSLSSDGLTLHGFEIATVLTRLNLPQVLEADHTVLAPDAEAAQPLYARYWLHNRGPAPLGGLPAVAHLHPQHARRRTEFASAAAAYRGQRLQRHGAARQGAAAVPGRLDGRSRRAVVRAAARRAPGDRCGGDARRQPCRRGCIRCARNSR